MKKDIVIITIASLISNYLIICYVDWGWWDISTAEAGRRLIFLLLWAIKVTLLIAIWGSFKKDIMKFLNKEE